MPTLSILGSTGSIGTNTLDVAARLGKDFRVAGLAAGRNLGLLKKQVASFRPRLVSVKRKEDAEELRRILGRRGTRVVYGREGSEEVASFPENDIVVSAITGIEGLSPTLAAVRAGKRVALANKESMVVAGSLIRREAARSGSTIIPVDSEHSGIFQCLAGERKRHIRRVILTASGGPFLRTPIREMRHRSLREALRHPRWKMGKKVTIDSATLMNKGLELIEASWIFRLSPEVLDVLIHPQSIVHSLVEFRDGSILAQLSPTDMRIPIQYALTYPRRAESPLDPLDLSEVGRLEFYRVDARKFPLFGLARKALEEGGSLPVALNAANEEAVAAFLGSRISFTDIASVVEAAVEGHARRSLGTLEEIYSADREARARTREILKKRL